ELIAKGNGHKKSLGVTHNIVAKFLIPNTQYDNIVNIGCGWASGANLVGGFDWNITLQAVFSDPYNLYNIITDPFYATTYQNKYAFLVKEALEARDGKTIQLFDLAKSGHTSPYGKVEIDELDTIIAGEFGGKLTGNTLVLYEYGPPDFIRLISMLYDRDPGLNPVSELNGGEIFPPGVSASGDSYWQATFLGNPETVKNVLERYDGHFLPTDSGATPYVDETSVLGPPNSNDLTISDRFFESYKRDYNRLHDNANGKYGSKVDIVVIGNENIYEGGSNFRQYANSVTLNGNAVFACTFFPTFFGCSPDTIGGPAQGINEDFLHPFAKDLEKRARDYSKRMKKQAKNEGVTFINIIDLFSGHHSRFDDPTSPYYVASDPTYWAYMAEINALGQEVVADVMLHILNTGKKQYHRKHSDVFIDRALANEFQGVYGY
ncbi:MAG: hypothetical protein RPS47_09140, partial [Colwellia sp.]